MISFTSRMVAGTLLAGAIMVPMAEANALLTYTSNLEYKDTGGPSPTLSGTPYGVVTIQELSSTQVKVTVTLNSPEIAFLNTGGPHDPFLFNLTGNSPVTVTNAAGQTFYNGGYSTTPTSTEWTATPFGDFTNRIGCCNDKNGSANESLPPLVFTVTNAGGITFAGVGATFDGSGRLLTLGTGNHFLSNDGGWWFAADLDNGASSGNTFNVAARDAFTIRQTGSVPEPASWALMVGGFGLLGALMRRRTRSELTFS